MGPRLSNYSLFASAIMQGVSMGLAYAVVNKLVLLPHAKAYTDSKMRALESRLKQVEKAQHREEARQLEKKSEEVVDQWRSPTQNQIRRG